MTNKEELVTNEDNEVYEKKVLTEEDIAKHIIDTLAVNDKEGFREEFFQNHSFDQAQIYLNLTVEQRRKVHDFLTPKELSEVYDIIDEEDEEQIFTFLFDMDDAFCHCHRNDLS